MQRPNKKQHIRTAVLAAASGALTLSMLLGLLRTGGSAPSAGNLSDTAAVFEQTVSSLLSTEPARYIRTLSDSDLIAPVPNPDCYGTAASPAELTDILSTAADALNIRSPLFTVDTPIKSGTDIQYYLDESIFAVTWKQTIKNCTYTFSEVKIAHPSQLRRFYSEGKYNSGILHTTTEMAQSVNAVTASSGDYYSYRNFGIVVNEGIVYRANGQLLDTCYIDNKGDLLFTYVREIDGKTEVQNFVDENNVRFSLCFGPVLLLNGVNMTPFYYNSGEINENYPRAALCQMDELHYVLVCANMEAPDYQVPTVRQFADNLAELGIPTAYSLDGGQTAAIVFNNQLINTVSYGAQREISDIIYFATAVPNEQ